VIVIGVELTVGVLIPPQPMFTRVEAKNRAIRCSEVALSVVYLQIMSRLAEDVLMILPSGVCFRIDG